MGSAVNAMARRLTHRGPDDQGYLGFDGTLIQAHAKAPPNDPVQAMLAHRRLSIIDLSEGGHQPMSTPDGRYHIVFNGEIYNYLELRDQLKSQGHSFQSESDTEVLLTAFAHWGESCLRRLVGMFALAILDSQTTRLFIARDCFGIKPFYYTANDNRFAFASELKALMELPEVNRAVNPHAAYQFLRYALIDHSDATMFQDVHQLPPAHAAWVDLKHPSQCQPKPYWALHPETRHDISFDEAAQKLKSLFLESIQLHLRTDVPLGISISGGIDSSATAAAIRHLGGAAAQIHGFGFVADDPTLSEEPWIDRITEAARLKTHKTQPNASDRLAAIEHFLTAQDAPVGAASMLAQYFVFQKAHQHGIKVMLDGQGADELFAGYKTALSARLATLIRQGRWIAAQRLLGRIGRQTGLGHAKTLALGLLKSMPGPWRRRAGRWLGMDRTAPWINLPWFANQGVNVGMGIEVDDRKPLRDHMLHATMQTSLPHQLHHGDRSAMAFSIESRVPFLTPDLAQFAFGLPEHYLIDAQGRSKAILRHALRGLVPDAILGRTDKIGFAAPQAEWLDGLRPFVESNLQDDALDRVPGLDKDKLRLAWQNRGLHDNGLAHGIWRAVDLTRWAGHTNAVFETS